MRTFLCLLAALLGSAVSIRPLSSSISPSSHLGVENCTIEGLRCREEVAHETYFLGPISRDTGHSKRLPQSPPISPPPTAPTAPQPFHPPQTNSPTPRPRLSSNSSSPPQSPGLAEPLLQILLHPQVQRFPLHPHHLLLRSHDDEAV